MQTFIYIAQRTSADVARYIISFIAPPGYLTIAAATAAEKKKIYRQCAVNGFGELVISPGALRTGDSQIAITSAMHGHIGIVQHFLGGDWRGAAIYGGIVMASYRGDVAMIRGAIASIRANQAAIDAKTAHAGASDDTYYMYATFLMDAMDALKQKGGLPPQPVGPRDVMMASILAREYARVRPDVRCPEFGAIRHVGLREAFRCLFKD